MTDSIHIRPYEPRDRAAVRRIACDTADRGAPVESIFGDREVVADLVAGYYTDREPGALWVAERAGEVLGYLSGCLDSRRYQRAMLLSIVPRAVLRSLARGALWRRDTWRLGRAVAAAALRGGLRRRVPLDRFPAHLHVNLEPGARGDHVGRRLVERFFAQAAAAGLPGVHVATREDNEPACRFFERLGFAFLHRALCVNMGETPNLPEFSV